MPANGRVTGAELLVGRGLAEKLGAGRYVPTPDGVLLRHRLEVAAMSLPAHWGAPAVLRIDRKAIRPGPRQIVAFEILHWSFNGAGTSPEPTVLALALPILDWLLALGLDVDMRQLSSDRITLETDHPGALRHSLATAVRMEDGSGELSIGIDCVLVAILAQGVPWPIGLGRILPCYYGRGAGDHHELPSLRERAQLAGILVDLQPVAKLGAAVMAPCLLVSRGGWTVLTPEARHTAVGPEAALDMWQNCL